MQTASTSDRCHSTCFKRQCRRVIAVACTALHHSQPGNALSACKELSHSASERRALAKIVGLGKRGVHTVDRLTRTLLHADLDTEFWALDSCNQTLSKCPAPVRVAHVPQEDDSSLSARDMADLMGYWDVGATTNCADAGVVFILGSALRSPGGAPLMLKLVNQFRRQGFFVVVALTKPFEFEGLRKLEQAACLVENMQEVANLVVVVEQDVLTKASAELTMSQAVAISDNTLEHTVHSVLSALRAPEVLKLSSGSAAAAASSRGESAYSYNQIPGLDAWTYLWHGRDLRHIPRLLFPPMMALLSCPGHGTLGRGKAVIPLTSLGTAGEASTFTTLAEDAVRAAAESPFLDGRMGGASAVLCILRLPRRADDSVGAADLGTLHSAMVCDIHTVRSAAQVAAMTIRDLAGAHLTDIIVCPQPYDYRTDAEDSQHMCVEAALLVIGVLEDGASNIEPAATRAPQTMLPTAQLAAVPSAVTAAARLQQAPTTIRPRPAAAVPPPVADATKQGHKSNWRVLSAIAGGAAANSQGVSASGQRSDRQDESLLASSPSTPSSMVAHVLQQIPRLADSLVTSLVAQSLDLPPSAASWRHQQRAPAQDKQRTAYRIVEAGSVSEDQPDAEASAQVCDVRARAAGMLSRERA